MRMKTIAIDVGQYFKPIKGQRPWRARLGHGSFLTFDFGKRIKWGAHWRGEWHLWIYQANWSLWHGERKLADSGSERRIIDLAVRRLEGNGEVNKLASVNFDPVSSVTEFIFGQFRLVVSPADYLDDPDERDEYWLLFMPDGEVLTAGPAGLDVGPSDR